MNRKAWGVTLLMIALVSSTAWATGRHHHRGGDHPSRACDKNPIFKLFGCGSSETPTDETPTGGGTTAPAYDYRNYTEASNITTKVFSIGPRPNVCGDTETRSFTRQADTNGTLVSETRVRSLSGIPCQLDRNEYLATDAAYLWTQVFHERYDSFGQVTSQASRVLVNPLAVQSSAMPQGGHLAGATAMNTGAGTPTVGHVMDSVTVLGVESVSVPYGTFADCLKVEHSQQMTTATAPILRTSFSAISWLCPGLGEVKRIQGSGSLAEWVLTDVQ